MLGVMPVSSSKLRTVPVSNTEKKREKKRKRKEREKKKTTKDGSKLRPT